MVTDVNPIPNGILYIFEVRPDGTQVLVHTETPDHLLSNDELVAWQSHWQSQLTCGTYQFDYVTLAGIREAFNGDETLTSAELLKWQGLEVGKPSIPSLAGTIWNGHLTVSEVCADKPAQPVEEFTPTVPKPDTPAQAIELSVVIPPSANLTPLPTTPPPAETTTTTAAPQPVPSSELAVTGDHSGVMILLGVALVLIGGGVKRVAQRIA